MNRLARGLELKMAVVVVALALALAACGGSDPEVINVVVTRLSSSAQSAVYGQWPGQYIVAKSASDWDRQWAGRMSDTPCEMWDLVEGGQLRCVRPVKPELDFSQFMLIGVFLGDGGPGSYVTIDRIESTNGRLHVYFYRGYTPSPPGTAVAQVQHWLDELVLVPSTDDVVEFHRLPDRS